MYGRRIFIHLIFFFFFFFGGGEILVRGGYMHIASHCIASRFYASESINIRMIDF